MLTLTIVLGFIAGWQYRSVRQLRSKLTQADSEIEYLERQLAKKEKRAAPFYPKLVDF